MLRRYLPLAGWIALGAVSFLFLPAQGDSAVWTGAPVAEYVLALAAVGFGCWGFWRHGGRQITAAGVLCLSCAVMVGYAGLYWAKHAQGAFQGSIFDATAWAYFTTVAMYALFWSRTEGAFPQREAMAVDGVAAEWAIKVGGTLVVGCTVLSWAGAPGHPLLSGGAFVGTLLLSVGFFSVRGRPVQIHQLLLVGIAFLLYYEFVFKGAGFNSGGRLIVASLGLGIAIAFCLRLRGRGVKLLLLALAIPAIVFAGQIRVDQYRDVHYTPIAGGLGSVVAPLQFFGDLIDLSKAGQLHLGHGSTFEATIVAQVPRAVWPSKPIGFGAALTSFLEPSETVHNLNLAALSSGEWYFDFGWPGLIIMVIVVGWLVRWLDLLFATELGRPLGSKRRILTRVLFITLVAGMTDLFWTGTFTFDSRLFTRLVFLGALFIVWCLRSGAQPASTTVTAPTSHVAGLMRP